MRRTKNSSRSKSRSTEDWTSSWIKFEGEMVDILVDIDKKLYGPCVCTYRGKRFLYAKAKKAIYGCLRSSLLFYELFSGALTTWGFEKNPYDACTFNKMVNGSQLTVVFHLDDLKCSHIEKSAVDELLEQMSKRFGKETPLLITWGKIHDYLGMTIDYTVKGKVKFYMYDYVEQILGEVNPRYMKGSGVTPAGSSLFKVNDGAEKLSVKDADQYH